MNVGAELVSLVSRSTRGGYTYLQKHLNAVQSVLILVALVATGVVLLRSRAPVEIVLLTGPKGGEGEMLADAIVDALKRDSSLLGGSYIIRKEQTDGFEENRGRIERDTTGLMFALAHDGFGEATRIRTLLPIDNSVLHVLCRNEFLDSHIKSAKTDKAFSKVAMYLRSSSVHSKERKPRVYLGPPNSGTRQMANIVADYYQFQNDGFAPTGIGNWEDMRQALSSGELDLAFFLGPPSSTIISQIARDGKCCLLNLEEVDALVQGHGQVTKTTLAKHSYVPDENFCSVSMQTLSTRRVLICSSSMDTKTGFQLATGTRDALRPLIPHLDWSFTPPKQKEKPQLSYILHPGAEYLSSGRTPGVSNWIQQQINTWWSVIASIIVAAVASLLSWMNSKKSPPDYEAETDLTIDQIKSAQEILFEEIRSALHTLARLEGGLSLEEYAHWEALVTDFRSRSKAAMAEGLLDGDQYEHLLKGLRELRIELEFFHQKGKRKRIASSV